MPPAGSKKHVAALSVFIDGAEIAPEFRQKVKEVRVRDSLSLPASALVRILDPKGEKVDDDLFKIGKELEIKTGAMPQQSATSIFKGEIVAFEPEFTADGVFISIRGYDKSHRLQREKKVRTFQQMSAKDIVQKLTQEAALTGEFNVQQSLPVIDFLLQSGETDRELIRRFEREYDCQFYFEDGRFRFGEAGVNGGPVTLKYTDQLTTFRPRVSAVQQVKKVEVRGWDPERKQAITATASNGTATQQIGITRSSVADAYGQQSDVLVADRTIESSDEAQALAKSTLDRRAEAYVEAEGTCLGNPGVRAGKQVKIEGVGSKLSGTYVVSAATHLYRGGKGYTTSFQVSGRSERGLLDLMHPPPARDWARSLVVALVTNVNDPDQLGRVKVKYPVLPDAASGQEAESAWARVVTTAASNNRGLLMLPEVGDEVVVAFENGDARRALVIGALFNGVNKPGDELLQDQDGSFAVVSNKKAFVHTTEDFSIKSDQKMILQVGTDREEKADGKVKQEAGSSVELKAGSSYTIEAGASIKIKGASIEVQAQGSLKLKGATVDIQSDGPATLKGATVDVQGSAMTNIKGGIVNLG